MKNRELFGLEKGLNSVGKLTGVKFGYAVAKNLTKVMSELETIKSCLKKDDTWLEVEKKQQEIHVEFCDKNADDSPAVTNGMYTFNAQKDAHDKALAKLEKNNQDAYDARNKLNEEYNEFLEKDVSPDFKLHKLKIEFVPEAITTQQLFGILPILEEE